MARRKLGKLGTVVLTTGVLLAPAPDVRAMEGPEYFLDPTCETFSSGCQVLDMALGGGWPIRRLFNIVGDKSTGKTLLMIEACAQFLLYYKGEADIVYCEVEAAFDKEYAGALGMPLDAVRFIAEEMLVKTSKKGKSFRIPKEEYNEDEHIIQGNGGIYSVEDLEIVLTEVMDAAKRPVLFVCDSLDALSDDAELDREADDHATYGTQKAKHLSAMFRKLNQKLSGTNVTLGIVSQLRDAIGVIKGKKHKRSGGKAMDFYATHCVWLTYLGKIVRQKNDIKRVVGVDIRANVEKNKIGTPFREAIFPIIFGFGVEDVIAGTNWLVEHKKYKAVFSSLKEAASIVRAIDNMTQQDYLDLREDVNAAVRIGWREVEKTFLPIRRKYGSENQQQTKGG